MNDPNRPSGPPTRAEFEELRGYLYKVAKMAHDAETVSLRAEKASSGMKQTMDVTSHELSNVVGGIKTHVERASRGQTEQLTSILDQQREAVRLLQSQKQRAEQRSMLNLESEARKAEEIVKKARREHFERVYALTVPILLSAVTLFVGGLVAYYWPTHTGAPPSADVSPDAAHR